MADRSNAGSRQHLTVDTPPPQIPRDMTGPDNLIPLSPQWLLPKPGDNKPGMLSGDSHLNPHHSNHIDAVKGSGNLEEFQNAEKRRDAFWPSFPDAESGRHDRWRDEERETNSVCRDRWREGDRDKETTDTRRERRTDSSFGHSGDPRRAPSDRWNDSGNRENNFEQRRESKWNTRWGPDDKDSDGWRERRTDSSRDDEGSRDKGVPYQANTEREGEHYSRPWRPSSSQTRWRGDSPLTPGKQGQMFGYGRGRVGNGSSTFSAGRGRVAISSNNNGTSLFHPSGFLIDKPVIIHEDSSALRYSRTKLLDIYRIMDMRSYRKLLEGSIEVPSLTQVDPSEPLALTAPTSEELVILKDIDKGEIISSGTSQITKDVFVGQSPVDIVALRNAKLGSREDFFSAVDDSIDDNSERLKGQPLGFHDYVSYGKHVHQSGSDLKLDSSSNLHSHQDRILNEVLKSEGANLRKGDETAVRERVLECLTSQHAIPWRSKSMGECIPGSSDDWKDFSADVRPKASDVGWSRTQKVEEAKQMTNIPFPTSYPTHEGFQSEMSRDLRLKRQPSEILDRERDAHMMLGHGDLFVSSDNVASRKFQLQPSPEELFFHYKDPKGQIQGPFSGSDLIGWFEAGYFGIDLQVRLADAPLDAPFSLLGDIMPHLRMKARSPPGFSVHKHEAMSGSVTGKLVGQENMLEHISSGQRKQHDSATEAENHFLESLMSRDMGSSVGSFSFSEGVKGYANSNSSGISTLVGESGNDPNYLLAQRMLLDCQQSVPNHVPFWVGKDPASVPSKPELVLDSPAQYSKLVPPMADSPHSSAHVPQHVDLLSILQAAADKAPPAVNNSLPPWLNFPDAQHLITNTMPGGMGAIKNNIDVHHNQHFTSQAAYGVQPQHLQQPNQSSLSHMIPLPTDHSAHFVSPENLLSSVISQDPRVLNMLQQQYLLSQLQLQSQMPIPTQLSLMDKILLMKEQQKQEQQQQQLLLQQQQMLSQILAERHLQRPTGESPFGLLQAVRTAGNAPSNHLGPQHPSEMIQINNQMQTLNLQDGRAPGVPNLHMQDPEHVGFIVSSSPPSVPVSHPLLQHSVNLKGQTAVPEQIQNVPSFESVPAVLKADKTSSIEVMENSSQEGLQQDRTIDLDTDATYRGTEMVGIVASEEMKSVIALDVCPETSEQASSSQQVNDVKIPSEDILEQSPTKSLVVKDVKQLEDHEVKKSSEKKSKKQKNLKSQSTLDKLKGSSKSINSEPSKLDPEIEVESTLAIKSVFQSGGKESRSGTSLKVTNAKPVVDSEEPPNSQQAHFSSTKHGDKLETCTSKTEEAECASQSKMQTPFQQAWKPAPCLKAKSLLEIQQEEQKRARVEMFTSEIAASSNPASGFSSAPWSGVVANSDIKSNGTFHGGVSAQFVKGISVDNVNSRSMKSQLHDLLADVSVDSNEERADTSKTADRSFVVSHQEDVKAQTHIAIGDDGDFIEAKDMKKSRKKAAKAKSAAVKNPATVSSVDQVPMAPVEKSKNVRQAQQEKESSSVLPAGLSLGDFVPWKGDESNSSPPPAWSTDSLRVQKPTSLRDIVKEQEKKALSVQKQIPTVAPAKAPQNRNAQGNSSSLQIPGSSPSKAVSPIKHTLFSPPKSKIEDDLFWGPLDQPKQESKHLDFPLLATSSSWGTKGTPSKNASAAASVRPKSSSRTYPLSSSAAGQSSLRGRGDPMSKHSEAIGFRDWCERELVRLTGSKDTGFLEFCLKQSTPEAEMLLRENLGSLDPHHEFIEKVLNYKELLAADVLEIAFQSHLALDSGAYGSVYMTADNTDADTLTGPDGSDKKGGAAKKKGKKGKKVSPSVLGFNVVSNRIMKGEIQSVED